MKQDAMRDQQRYGHGRPPACHAIILLNTYRGLTMRTVHPTVSHLQCASTTQLRPASLARYNAPSAVRNRDFQSGDAGASIAKPMLTV